jgi:hypothetical protein
MAQPRLRLADFNLLDGYYCCSKSLNDDFETYIFIHSNKGKLAKSVNYNFTSNLDKAGDFKSSDAFSSDKPSS